MVEHNKFLHSDVNTLQQVIWSILLKLLWCNQLFSLREQFVFHMGDLGL